MLFKIEKSEKTRNKIVEVGELEEMGCKWVRTVLVVRTLVGKADRADRAGLVEDFVEFKLLCWKNCG